MKRIIPFNIELAKQGAKIVTRCGYSVRIGFYDVKNKFYPILALVQDGEYEIPYSFTKNGKFHRKENEDSSYDLFIEEEVDEEDNYNPYKEVVKSITDMVERYSAFGSDLVDFYDNVKVKCREAVAYEKKWLEKQGKQKTADNKPKFQVGDWVIDGLGIVHQIIRVVENPGSHTYGYGTDDGFYIYDSESGVRLWNINDAKDGDVLCSGEVIFIFNRIKGEWIHCYCTLHRDGSFISENYDLMHIKHCKEVQPATKEQYDLLFQKMKEAGYEWDSDKKELKKIEEAKTRRMTNQELSWWLRDCQQERREVCRVDEETIYSRYIYRKCDANEEVPEFVRIRKNGGEWEEPLVEE